MGNPDAAAWIETDAGKVPRVGSELTAGDRWGAFRVRWGVGRMDYQVTPGLYAIGNPGPDSHVFVTANYKLTFDILREALGGLDAWVMVLDTKGINVWCAAGKGTFGTDEVVNRIERTRVGKVVRHRSLILPQLGATGVSAHEVKRRSGFAVTFGPIRAPDIKPFLKAGMVATREMRRVTFSFRDRLVLVPLALAQGLKYLAVVLPLFLVLSGITPDGYSQAAIREAGLKAAANLLMAYVAGTAIFPVLLPFLPGRAFAFKGLVLGLVMAALSAGFGWIGRGYIEAAAWALIVPVIVSFAAMSFTGATPITSLSGVRKEMRVAVPLQAVGAATGLALWIVGRLI